MFGNLVVIGDWTNHLDVEFLLIISESGFKNDEVVAVEIGFKVHSFGKGGHFSTCEVDSSLYFSGAIAELEHVGVVFPVAVFKSGYNGDGVELLVIESGVVFEFVVDLVDSEGNDGFVVDWFVLFFG